jgi:NAD(P)-dependent dehydrogenase (short-subunit alcohol dehydrogenase family)
VVDIAVSEVGRLDLPVNSAATTQGAELFTLNDQDWNDGVTSKAHGDVRMMREALPHLCQSGGSIVNIVDTGARAGPAAVTIGCAVNVAWCNVTTAMPDNAAGQGVRINAFNPDLIAMARIRTESACRRATGSV